MEKDTDKLQLDKINFERKWTFPKPKDNEEITLTQQNFLNEYYPSGHKIYDAAYFPDKEITIEVPAVKGGQPAHKMVLPVKVKRIALALQSMVIDVIMPHLLGSDIVNKQIVVDKKNEDAEAITLFNNLWKYKNIHHKIWEFIEDSLICGESALYFYFDEGKLQAKTLSYIKGDELCPKYNKFGNVETLYRKYKSIDEDGDEKTYIDKIDKTSVSTYNEDGELISTDQHPFPFIPVVFHRRRDGAYWSKVQSSIDSIEWNISALSEDNKSKTKGKYHIKATNPKQVQSTTIGGSDVIVTDINGDFKLIDPVNLSEAFKYEYDALKENIFDPLGIVFLKMKASGDMPTGSMKLLFYATERVCRQLTKEYSDAVQTICNIFKKGLGMEIPNIKVNDDKFIIMSSIPVFVPSDDIATLTATADAYSKNGMTFKSVVRANPKFLEATDVEEKKQENEEKARLNNIGKEVTIKDEEVVEEEDKDKENKPIEKTEE